MKFDLKKERNKARLLQEELSNMTGFSIDTIQRCEKNPDHRMNVFFKLWLKEYMLKK